jgi:hypothetical protein
MYKRCWRTGAGLAGPAGPAGPEEQGHDGKADGRDREGHVGHDDDVKALLAIGGPEIAAAARGAGVFWMLGSLGAPAAGGDGSLLCICHQASTGMYSQSMVAIVYVLHFY